ncbi:hypothetical protein TNCT_618951 [Trichonephila clavata]|uniref:Uncharacterized protein n=1 Tax=Trichonephila clavata TaxID=2740835 RepID=A0A8X6G0E8_TRICU|nr:hypothetical protein TNCT_618951 [Trichonephila clavata]
MNMFSALIDMIDEDDSFLKKLRPVIRHGAFLTTLRQNCLILSHLQSRKFYDPLGPTSGSSGVCDNGADGTNIGSIYCRRYSDKLFYIQGSCLDLTG